MEVEIEDEIPFPCLMSSYDGVIVLFHGYGKGIVLNGSKYINIGDYKDDWEMSDFEPFKGKSILNNSEKSKLVQGEYIKEGEEDITFPCLMGSESGKVVLFSNYDIGFEVKSFIFGRFRDNWNMYKFKPIKDKNQLSND